MKVKKLIELLKKEDPNRIVILSSDREGNKFSPLSADFQIGSYVKDTEYSGDVGLEQLTEEYIAQGFSEEDVYEDGESALVFYPIN